MRCREFEDRMNDVLDQRHAPERDALLLRHAGECDPCRQLLAGQAVLFAGVELLETPSPSGEFSAVVLAEAGLGPAITPATFPRRKSKWLAIAAGLASLAAIVLVAVLIDMASQQPQISSVAAKPASNSSPRAAEVTTNSKPQSQITPAAITKAVVPPRVVPAISEHQNYQEYQEMLTSLTAQFPTAVEKIDEVQQSTPAIRPLRASFSMAIGTLQRTIPSRNKKEHRSIKPDSGFYGNLRNVVV